MSLGIVDSIVGDGFRPYMDDGSPISRDEFNKVLDALMVDIGRSIPQDMQEEVPSKPKRARVSKSAGSLDRIKGDWKLFWEALFSEEKQESSPVFKSLGQVKDYKKSLSHSRRILHEKLESITREIDQLKSKSAVDVNTINQRINELSDMGFRISNELSRIPEKLQWADNQEQLFLRLREF